MSIRFSALGTILFTLSACSPMIDVHGDSVDEDVIASLIPGETVYTEVRQRLGSPSSKTIFDTENWIYLYSKKERFAFFEPKETYRNLTVLKFSRDGVLQKIETKTLDDGHPVVPAPADKKSDRDSLTVLDQMIANVGRMGTETAAH